ncbi:MAG: tetratricopeptide repeat protein, partial [Prolixibacteraceae bacterium]|nr:tetratricopeptide repeat protein [Prolixibacteraceae bacterium]
MRSSIIILFMLITLLGYGQKERRFIREGNRYYKNAVENSDSSHIDSVNFVNAEVAYRKALDKKNNDLKATFNIGNSLFKQNKMAEAASQFEQALQLASSNEEKAKVHFNYGNAMLGQQKLDESIEAYKNALRNNPSDMEAKYNLEFARKMKEQQQQQQQQQQQNQDQDQNQDQNQDKNQDQQQDQNQDQNKD